MRSEDTVSAGAPADGRRKSKAARAGARPSRSKVVTVRLTPDEHAAISAAASQADVSVSSFLRLAVTTRADEMRPSRPLTPEQSDVMTGVLDLLSNTNLQLKRIGNNLNQIARAVNSGDVLDAEMMNDEVRRLAEAEMLLRGMSYRVDRAL